MNDFHGRRFLYSVLTAYLFALAFLCVGNVGSVASGQESTVSYPSLDWLAATPADVGLDATLLDTARQYSLSAGGSGMIVRGGKVVLRWGDQKKRYDIKSATKSFGATMLGIAIADGKVKLDDLASQHHDSFGVPPESNATSGWAKRVTLLQLATQTAGFDKRGGYEKLLFEPGTQWHYSDGGPNWLAECLTLAYGRDLQDVMFERVFSPIGISRDDLSWRENQYREHRITLPARERATLPEGPEGALSSPGGVGNEVARREFGAGIHANVEALSRLGYLYLREGLWNGEPLLAKDFVLRASRPVESVVGLPEWGDDKSHGNASDCYGLLWWNNHDGSLRRVPRDAYWAWGLYDSLIVVIPSLDLVVVRAGENGRNLARAENVGHYDVLRPLLEPIVRATGTSVDNAALPDAPYPASDLIVGIEWAPVDSIVRRAKGSDNWPMTWGDDDRLYTAYGDGWGFKPMTKKKLSLGLASIEGNPPNFRGHNIRSAVEQEGQGADGQKASGMLMVDGVLYMLVRNADNSRLGWSKDRGKTWEWAGWKWSHSFGCPTFLNFGKDYSGRPDHVGEFVYVYSLDSDSAYEPADRMVMARVPKDRIRDQDAYEFFAGADPTTGKVSWTKELAKRAAVFTHAGSCYRSSVTFSAGLQRYLWCQTLPKSTDSRGPRYQGGFGIYEAPKPWGPWRTVFFTRDWDVGPGETSSFATKWMSADGRTLHLVFSGDDCFSVRKATLRTASAAGR